MSLSKYLLVSSCLLASNAAQDVIDPAVDKPNIVFILADDLGWGNVGYHNTENPEIRTPHIDYLVENGLQLNRHYVDPECSPTRTSFQSGRLPVHVNTNNNDGILDSTMGIPPDMTCVADKFKEAGYSTHMIGKWDSGFASFRQIPISRGYDTSYGYLGKSIEYYTKKGDSLCSAGYIDLWENDAPAFSSVKDVNTETYIEHEFASRVLEKLEQLAEVESPNPSDSSSKLSSNLRTSEPDPFFIFYASHLPHYPAQLPPDSIENGFYVDFELDENQCANGLAEMVFPGYYIEKSDWRCRSVLQAQVAMLDSIVGDITAKLVELDLWDNTLIVFSTDNGGSMELTETAGNNYPLRGGKATFLEGGIRGTAFVSGGYLPESRRGKLTNGLMHIADWYTTFSTMLGLDAEDYNALDAGLPGVDGFNMWPMIVGEVDESPRTELIMSKNVYIEGDWKLIIGSSTKYAIWTSAYYPNATSMTQAELEETVLVCDAKKEWGCLFNVLEDPSEYSDLSEVYPDKLKQMRNKLIRAKGAFFESSFVGRNSCPLDFDDVAAGEYINVDDLDDSETLTEGAAQHACGCWMTQHNYNQFAGPYMDLTDDQKQFDANKLSSGDAVFGSALSAVLAVDKKDYVMQFVIYAALVVSTAVLLTVALCLSCKSRKKEHAVANGKRPTGYGTIIRV